MSVRGCDLPEGLCASDEELVGELVNYVQVHAYPDLLTPGKYSPLRYQMEFSRYFNILPDTEITENAYFMENTVAF